MSASKKEKIDMRFSIKSVDVLNSSYSTPNLPSPIINGFNFDIMLESKLDQKNKFILVVALIKITTNDDAKIQLGEISVGCVYLVENFDELIKWNGDNKPIIPDEVVVLLNSISISTTRGVMSQVFKGTFLHNAVLPVLDPKAFAKQNV